MIETSNYHSDKEIKMETEEHPRETSTHDDDESPLTSPMNRAVPPYARLFFDHLYSEYQVLRSTIRDADVTNLLEEIYQMRQRHELTWANIYTFDLMLVDWRPPASLIRKAFEARSKYRSIAGQKEYDEYQASKPPDLVEVHFEPDAPPPNPIELVRADIRYLLSKFYLYYAMLPVRESLRDQLTYRAAMVTGIVVVAIFLAIVLNLFVSFIPNKVGLAQYAVVFVTVLTVTLAGLIGGCVSMLQRIQSAPSEGDALFNLAAMTNGKRGILLSPLYGGIFASLLFVLFAAGILNGTIFPVINTPKSALAVVPGPSPTPTATPITSATPTGNATTGNTTSGNGSASTSTEIRQTEVVKGSVLQIKDFLSETGPADGVSYALLIIWSFLAGFAERLVPDTLNRLVAKNQAIQGNDR
jgi:hypothetical protein